jgi:gas vesicle protein
MATKEQACIAGALMGAAVGAALGFLYATDDGARRRMQLVDAADRLMIDADEARRLWLRLSEAWTRFQQDTGRHVTPGGDARGWHPEGVA